jgi:methyl-accepting chemotaxis protein
MTDKNARQPIRHFFIKKSIQYKIIGKIIFVVFLTALLTTITVSLVYNAKSQNGRFYYMGNDAKQDLELDNILEIVLPSVIGAQVISMLIGLGIGLFSSRKIAVPIYKFEKWVTQLKTGNLLTRIEFREKEEMEDLTHECNTLVDFYRDKFVLINEAVCNLEKKNDSNPEIKEPIAALRQILQKVNFN